MSSGASPRVSVLMPVYNAERFLEESVASVFAQSYPSWELLLIDDGSTDRSPTLARQAAAKDPGRVRILEHPGRSRRGMSASRNLGLQNGRGEFVALLDADDVWMPTALVEQVEILDRHPEAAMVFGRSQYWYSWAGRPEDFEDKVPRLGVEPGRILEPPRMLERILRGQAGAPCTCSVLVRRAAAKRIGGFEESFRTNHSDQAFYAKLLLAEPVLASRRVWSRYRRHAGSAIGRLRSSGGAAAAQLAFLDWLGDYLARTGAGDAGLREAFEKERARVQARARAEANARRWPPRARRALSRSLPAAARRWLRHVRGGPGRIPPVGDVRLGDLRRADGFSRGWGAERGLPLDRYYIERFLASHAADIRGRVLEIGDDSYTWRFGGSAVTDTDILDVREDRGATIIDDLARGDAIPSDRFDAVVFTQTLQLLYDIRSAVRTLHRILKPSGVLLATVPGISRIGKPDDWGETWYWSFTPLSAQRLFGEFFPAEGLAVECRGNALAATAFLYGLAAEELTREELEQQNLQYPVSILIRAVKAGGGVPSP